ncbi:hypothetical protein ONZ45_g1868 [Pleurotus djamor]|nr:hypothetical protein ONZ45_g1868 [Pleurotus djamor]
MTSIASRTNGPSRRTPSSPSPTPPSTLTRGPTARAAASSRPASTLGSPTARRASLKASTSPILNGETKESLALSLKRETEQKEKLLVQLQDKDTAVSELGSQVEELTATLDAARTRVNEFYAEQARSEAELANHMEVAEKLRSQVRELEKEKRDIQRRYNEQTTSFEAERQSFYDNEQHLKSRIQSLSQARKRPEPEPEPEPEPFEPITDEEDSPRFPKDVETKQDLNDPETEPAEMTSLKLELSTLSTSYTSLQSTLVLLQSQLVDLKRVNNELQEENESFMILLREKTLSGQFDVMRQVGGTSSSSVDDDYDDLDNDNGSLRSIGRNTLDRVEERPEDDLEDVLDDHSAHHTGRSGRRQAGSSPTRQPRGESLADLPITGPGLDLAAELGRAENKDILEGNQLDDSRGLGKGKRSKKGSDRKVSGESAIGLSSSEVETLRTEVKSLKDANKALSLYASKIIDRIVAQGGFERVLAVDYDDTTPTPVATVPKVTPVSTPQLPPVSKPRPQSLLVGRSTSNPDSSSSASGSPAFPHVPKLDTTTANTTAKAQRRSMSFDWKTFSLFAPEKKPENPALRPLTLKPGSSPVTARKLDTHEDEEDRKERERLNATMKLMGIQPSPSPVVPPSPAVPPVSTPNASSSTPNRRFSFFGFSKPTDNPETSSMKSTSSQGQTSIGLGLGGADLTKEALEQAEAENTLAALDAHERQLSADIARGGSSGFTEIAPRSSRRSRRSAGGSGSGSTVWSAGNEHEDGE